MTLINNTNLEKIKLIASFSALILLMSCGNTANIYHSNNVAQPMFDGKFQGNFDIGIGPGEAKNNYLLSGAISITDHWFVSGSTISLNDPNVNEYSPGNDNIGLKVNNNDLSIGYYSIFDKKERRRGYKYSGFDLQAGYGWGNGQNQTNPLSFPNTFMGSEPSDKSRFINSGIYNRIFIQPSIYWKYNAFQFGLALKTSYLQVNNYQSNKDTLVEDKSKYSGTWHYYSGYAPVGSYTSTKDGFLLFEPAMTIRTGYKWIFVYFQTAATIAPQIYGRGISINCTDCGYAFRPLNFKFGISLQLDALNPLRKKQNN